MNIFQKISRRVVEGSFELAITIIENFSEMNPYYEKVNELGNFSNGTLGKGIADCLDHHNLTLVPKYESHDLKHVLLDYEMTAEGEIRLQAFMLGNGNYTFPCFAILIFGLILLPELWLTFYKDYKKGRNSLPISEWTITKYANSDLAMLQFELTKPIFKKRIVDMKRVIRIASYVSITSGFFGMVFCLPFLFSSSITDLIGAGFPFVGGAILAVGGLLALSNLSQPNNNRHEIIPA